MFNDYFLAFVPIFVAVDALGMIPVFMSLTHGMKEAERQKLIRHSTLTALLVAIVFLWVGKAVFALLGITIADFMVAGGAILFVISITDLLTFGKRAGVPGETFGVVPLAVPLMAGPAVFASSLILVDALGVYPTLFAIVANVVLCGTVLYFSSSISKVLGEVGSHTLSKIFSLLLGAIGVMLMRRGLIDILSSWLGH